MTTKTRYIEKTTPELQVGDVVNCHGMRCLVTEPLKQSHAHGIDSGVVYTAAKVLNRDEVPGSRVPLSFTARSHGEGFPTTHRWTIQGNELARWSVEVAELDPLGETTGATGSPATSARKIADFEKAELQVELIALRNVQESAWTIGHSIRKRELERELEKRRTRELMAERELLDRFDILRSSAGHDYGSGQRARELGRLERELDRLDPRHEEEPVTDAELVAAWDRIAPARVGRLAVEGYRAHTQPTIRTRKTWERLGRSIDALRRQAADPLGEVATKTESVADALEGEAGQDPAVSYFVETIERRIAAEVVNVEQYLALTREHLNAAAAEIDADELLQDDQKREKLARAAAKLSELDRIEAELEAAKTSPLVGSGQCVNCGGYPNATASSMDDPPAAGCSCIGDYAPAWKRDDVAELEARAEHVERSIERLRGEQGGEDWPKRREAWEVAWTARFEELRWIAERVAELTPLPPARARELAREALRVTAESRASMARTHYIEPDGFREAHALAKVAGILADDGSSPYVMVSRAELEEIANAVPDEADHHRQLDALLDRLQGWARERLER